MLVNWKGGDRVLTVPLIDVNAKQDATIPANHDQVVLMPGWNDVPEGQFDIMLPHLRDKIDNDTLEFYAKRDKVEEEVEVEVTEDVEVLDKAGKPTGAFEKKTFLRKEVRVTEKYIDQPLREIRTDKAREIVKGCLSVKNLTEWTNDPKVASEIRNLADMQLNKIKEYNGENSETMMTF